MLKELNIKSRYVIPRDDVSNDFINPVLKESVRYDRVSAYFSSKSLSLYSEGLEYFSHSKNNKFRLIVSHFLSKEDYEYIKQGYDLREKIESELLNNLEEQLSLKEIKNLSNLSYLISIGIVDIKIGFIHNGLFHSKFGIFYDEFGNKIYYTGSMNETINGISNNYEEIFVHCNWLTDNDFYWNEINKTIDEFEKMWNNQHDFVFVIKPTKLIFDKLEKFNKGELIFDELMIENDSVIFDYKENEFKLMINSKNYNSILNSYNYYSKIKHFQNRVNNSVVYFKNLSFKNLLHIEKNLILISSENNLKYCRSKNLEKYILEKNIFIEERFKIGKYIKQRHNDIIEEFNNYKFHVNKLIKRELKERQIWDSFFMYKMFKSANFSVPGSGKTTSVLSCFAYLNELNKCNKIVVICPKNSFGSWIDEFNINFNGIKDLKLFNCHDKKFFDNQDKKNYLKYKSFNDNLFLFNYESLIALKNEIKDIISNKCLLVFDEVHKIKKINGKYALLSLELAKESGYTIVMSGTPIPNSFSDIYNLLNIMYPNDYNDFFGFQPDRLKNPKTYEINDINEKIYSFFCRTTKKDLLIPPINKDKIISIDANDIEQRIFNILYKSLSNNHLCLFIRILQLESNPNLLLSNISKETLIEVFDEDYEDINKSQIRDFNDELYDLVSQLDKTSKFNECIKLINKMISENKTIILWCIFKDTIQKFQNILSSMNIKCMSIYGEIELENRNKIINLFKNGSIQILITNPHTLAESVSLHDICHDAIYFEYSYNLVHFLQSKDRIHRLGLKEDQYTQLYFMQTNYKINSHNYNFSDKIYNRLIEKEQIMLNSIENEILEILPSMDDDLKEIFNNL